MAPSGLARREIHSTLFAVRGMYHTADGLNPEAPSMQKFYTSMVNHLRTYLAAAE